MDSKTLLDVAALLVSMAGTQPVTNPKEAEIVAVWQEMVRQAQERTKPHDFVDLKPGTPYWETGTNEKESPFYQKFINFWKAMEREHVPDQSKKPFTYQEAIKRGGNAEFEASVKFLAKTDAGRAWFADPLNANYLPKPADMLLLM
jgi:hypothetical protein